jgi:hypothetical protein
MHRAYSMLIEHLQDDNKINNQELRQRSSSSRIHSSIVQFFKGSFWSPPESTKRVRRPPSQWWNAIDPLQKSHRKPKKSLVADVEVNPTYHSLINQISRSSEPEKNQEASIVRRDPSSQIYDFSD